ncbi:MAG: glyoxylase I family protein [Candidatus Azotimanducaceae bacterium]|jgi:glyoxylase I family protein
MFKVAGIDHIVLRTANKQALMNFYEGILGCEIERDTSIEMGLTQLRAGNALIDIVAVDSKLGSMGGPAPSAQGNNLDHFCLQLEPVTEEDIRSHLVSHGITVGDFADRYGAEGQGKSIYIEDPDGNVVELRSKLA